MKPPSLINSVVIASTKKLCKSIKADYKFLFSIKFAHGILTREKIQQKKSRHLSEKGDYNRRGCEGPFFSPLQYSRIIMEISMFSFFVVCWMENYPLSMEKKTSLIRSTLYHSNV